LSESVVPPVADVQTHRILAGGDWAWVDTAPVQGWGGGLGLEWAEDLLVAQDRDETFSVVPRLGEATLYGSVMQGKTGVMLTAPVRWVPGRELGLGSAQVSVIAAWDSGVLIRGTAHATSNLGWGSAWSSVRTEVAASWSIDSLGVGAAATWGEEGWETRASAGVSVMTVDVEAAWSRSWTQLPVGTLEVGVGRGFTAGAWELRPFVSGGIGQTPGTPSVRALLTVSTAKGLRDPGYSEAASKMEPLVPPIPDREVEQTAGGAAQAEAGGQPDGWLPFPPTSPDVPAFSVPIVEVDPAPAPEAPKGYKGVSQVSGVMASNPQILLVEIRVHSECAGGGAAAQRASEAAAARIKEFVVSQGIAEGRLSMVPMGCTRPVRSPEVTAEDRAANRRIEVVVVEVADGPQ